METYSKIILAQDYKQIRMTISEFKGEEYLHFREYYLDFDEEWKPTNKGIHIPLELDTSKELFRGMSEILSLAENREVLEEYFSEIIQDVYQK
jgi:hypothetical protein